MTTLEPGMVATQRSTGALLRQYRLAAALTQEELAERSGVSARTISDLERGLSRAPRRDTLALLSAALVLSAQQHAALVASALNAAHEQRAGSQAAHADAQRVSPVPLVGRGEELYLIGQHLGGDGPPVLLFAGQPGIGKSRLLREAALLAPRHGWRILCGGCSRREDPAPYAPLLQALSGLLDAYPRTRLRALLAGCAWLVRLLPELAAAPIERLPAWSLSPEQERRLVFASVLRLLRNVSVSDAGDMASGILLVLDDLQWAGADALDLLATLVRAWPGLPVRVIGSYRDTDVQPDDPLFTWLAELAEAELARGATLRPLPTQHARALLEEVLGDQGAVSTALRLRLVQRTGGVPFFLTSCARLVRRVSDDGDADALPWDLQQSVRLRLAALPCSLQDLLGIAALIGRTSPRRLLLLVAALPEGTVIPLLDIACRAQVLEEAGADSYGFVHDVIREVVEAGLGLAQRRALHRRIAYALELLPGEQPVEALVYHFSRSDEDERTLFYLGRAGDRALAQGAHAAAEGYYRDLVERLYDLGRLPEGAHACERLSFALTSAGRYDDALQVLVRAERTYAALGDVAGRERVSAQAAWSYFLRGDWSQGLHQVQPLLDSSPDPGLPATRATAVKLQAMLMHLFSASGRYRDSIVAAEQTIVAARALGDQRILADAEGRRGASLICLGHLEEGRRSLESALDFAQSVGDLECLYQALYHLARSYLAQGALRRSNQYFARAVAVFDQLGDPARTANAIAEHGYVLFLLGEWSEARREGERALVLMLTAGPSYVAANPRLRLGQINLAEGRWSDALRYLEETIAIAERIGNPAPQVQAHQLLADYELRMGQPDTAYARLLRVRDRPDIGQELKMPLLPQLACILYALGEHGQAHDLATQACAYARAKHLALLEVEALHAAALAARGQGAEQEALRAAEDGLSRAQRTEYRHAAARLLHLQGLLYRDRGEQQAAEERLAAAHALYATLGAAPDVEIIMRDRSLR